MLTERSVEMPPTLPEDIRLFRRGILTLAQQAYDDHHADPPRDDDEPFDPDDALYEQIWITLVHEIGHHFGMSEDDLDQLGYA
jgi:predicted Zn-dependent protease with MMP-like domain